MILENIVFLFKRRKMGNLCPPLYIHLLTVCDFPKRFKLYSRELHFDHTFDFEKEPKMTKVPQFHSAANLRDSHSINWTMKMNENFTELIVLDIIS